jgi:hypothetical protein
MGSTVQGLGRTEGCLGCRPCLIVREVRSSLARSGSRPHVSGFPLPTWTARCRGSFLLRLPYMARFGKRCQSLNPTQNLW